MSRNRLMGLTFTIRTILARIIHWSSDDEVLALAIHPVPETLLARQASHGHAGGVNVLLVSATVSHKLLGTHLGFVLRRLKVGLEFV